MGYEDEMEDFYDEEEFNKKQLEQLKKEILDEAKKVVENYVDNPSDISGSVVNIHENSPFMDEMYNETGWKHVIHGDIEDAIKTIKKTKKNKKNT